MHAISRHDGIADQDKVDVGETGQDLGICRLGRDLADFAVFAEDAVECLL